MAHHYDIVHSQIPPIFTNSPDIPYLAISVHKRPAPLVFGRISFHHQEHNIRITVCRHALLPLWRDIAELGVRVLPEPYGHTEVDRYR